MAERAGAVKSILIRPAVRVFDSHGQCVGRRDTHNRRSGVLRQTKAIKHLSDRGLGWGAQKRSHRLQ